MQTISHKNLILLSILLAVFVVPSSISGTAIALPYIARDLGDNPTLLQWVVNAFNLFFAAFTLIWGSLSDRFGATKALKFGISLFLLGSLLSSLANSLALLDIARAIAGIGGASVFACGSAILIKSFEENKEWLITWVILVVIVVIITTYRIKKERTDKNKKSVR